MEALVREVQEETGLKVGYVEPMDLYSGPEQRFKYFNGDEIQCFSLASSIRSWKGKPRVDGIEGSELRFRPPNGLPENLIEKHAVTLEDFRRYEGCFFLSGTGSRNKWSGQ